MGQDDWRYHYYDTVKAGDGLGDLEAISYMCRNGSQAVYELENYGLPFSRNSEGKILQSLFEGHTSHYGRYPMPRSAVSFNKIGHSILHTLSSRAMKVGCIFLVDFFALDLIIVDGICRGVIAWDLRTGSIHVINANSTVIATGGSGRMFEFTTQGHMSTGDGQALVARAGLPNQDLEFFQFHPTGLHASGIFISDNLRELGALRNACGEKFMEKYSHLEISKKFICQAMSKEIRQGHGLSLYGDYLLLDLANVNLHDLKSEHKETAAMLKSIKGINIFQQAIPVVPSAHFQIGGIPVDSKTRVISKLEGDILPGLYAVGEAACASVHGADRIEGNSLLEAVVFGKAAGIAISEERKPGDPHIELPKNLGEDAAEKIEKIRVAKGSEKLSDIRKQLKQIMHIHAGVIRNSSIEKGIKEIDYLVGMLKNIRIHDRGIIYNTEIIEAMELENLIFVAKQTLVSALNRQESRGVHIREDFPEKNDKKFLKHTMSWLDSMDGEVDIKRRQLAESEQDSKISSTFSLYSDN